MAYEVVQRIKNFDSIKLIKAIGLGLNYDKLAKPIGEKCKDAVRLEFHGDGSLIMKPAHPTEIRIAELNETVKNK